MTLQRYLTRLVWLSTLPILALALGLSHSRFAAERDGEDQRAERVAARLALTLDRGLQARIDSLHVLSHSPLVEEARWDELREAATGFREGLGGELILVDAQRRWRFHSGVPPERPLQLPLLPRPQGRGAVDAVLQTGRPAIGDPLLEPVAGETLVAIAVPVDRAAQPRPLVLANVVPVNRLGDLFDVAAIPAAWSATLRDSQGREVWRRDAEAPPDAPAVGERALARFSDRLDVAPWTVEVELPRTTYLQSVLHNSSGLLVLLVGGLLASMLVGHWGKQRLARSVRSLVAVDGPGAHADEIDEFRQARRLLEDAMARRAAADDALQVREEQLRGIFASATEAIVTADASQTIVLANPAAARMFGWSLEELTGMPLGRLIPERHRARHREEVERFGREHGATRTMGHPSDVVGLRADGTEFAIEAAISQVHVDGQRLYTVILRDVTERRQAEAQVAGAKARLEAAIEGMRDGLVMLGTDGRIAEVNSAYARMYGFPDKQGCVGQAVECEHLLEVETLDGSPVPLADRPSARALRGETGTGVELRVRRRDGGRAWVGSFSYAPVQDAQGSELGAVVTVRDVTERLRLEQDLQASHAELASLMAAQVGTEERERRRIARELHDELQQVLAAIKMDASAIEPELHADPGRVPAIATRIDDLASAAIVSSRRIVNDLRPLLLEELGLVPALRNLAQQFGERSGMRVAFDDATREAPRDPPDAVAICLYRVAQEALNNVGKHAGARRVRITLSTPEGGGWRMAIADDGRGMRPEDWRRSSSHGLRGMHERVRGLGGSLRIDGGEGRGVSITVEFPADGAASTLPH